MGYLLDTNIITAHLKNNKKITEKIIKEPEIFISVISYFEIKRGLLAINATRKIADFNYLCQDLKILYLDDLAIIEKASEIYADLKNRGQMIQDADILIAATAIIKNLTLVSQDSDLQRVKDLTLENWLN